MNRLPQAVVVLVVWVTTVNGLLAEPPLAAAPTPATDGVSADARPAAWEVLGQRPGQGQQCLVCRKQVFGSDVVQVRYKGRTFFVAAGDMFELFQRDPDRYISRIQARSVLFDEAALGGKPVSLFWLGLGVYALMGLVAGAACGYMAISKGLSAAGWFFAGLVGNAVVLAVLLNTRGRDDPSAPDGVPPGLAKVPTTRGPHRCGGCGAVNHPSAARCHRCGVALDPAVESEVARVSSKGR